MRKLLHIVCSVLLSAGIVHGPVLAENTDSTGDFMQDSKHCTMGDITAVLENAPIGFFYASNWPANIKIAGLGAAPDCQFRLFFTEKPTNGERFTYCEEDIFLGGVNYLYDYFNFGVSRQVAIEDLEQFETTVLFGPLNGALIEQSIIKTAYKNYIHPTFGKTVYRQDAFITQEAPGEYEWNFGATYMGVPIITVNGVLEVVSHEEHLNRVENGTWRTW